MQKSMLAAVAAAACAAASPVQAVAEAQDAFVQLVQPEPPVAMQAEQRAAALPALAMLPPESDAVLVAAQAGESAVALMELLGCDKQECAAQLGSIGSAAMSAGGGSAGAFERALPALVFATQLSSLEEWERVWSAHAKPELVQAIHRGFEEQKQLVQRSLQAVLADCHPKPLYLALTAAPGREGEFQNLCRSIQQAMMRATQEGKWQRAEQAGYTAAIRTTQLHAWAMLTGQEPQNAELREQLAQRPLLLLMQVQEGAMLLALCEQQADIALPGSAQESLLYTPLLAGADAHMPQLRAAAWVSPVFFRALQVSLYAEKNPLMQALANSFRYIGQADATHQNVYLTATRDVQLLDTPPAGDAPRISRPMTMQVWQASPKELRAHTSLDAWGATFAPGELRLAARATAPDTIYYAESTAISSHYIPHTESDGRWQAALNVGSALLLSLRAESHEALMPWLRGMEALAPAAEALGGSLRTLCAALGSPLALVSGDGAPGEDPAVSVCAVVENRAGLAEGWRQMLQALGQVAGQFGLAPEMITELPVQSRSLGDRAEEHKLMLPFLPNDMHPSVAVSDSYFVLGYSPALNERLLAASAVRADRMPFSGAVCAFSFPGWAKTARTMTDRAGDKPGKALSITRFLERLAQKATLLLHATTIREGAVESGCSVRLK